MSDTHLTKDQLEALKIQAEIKKLLAEAATSRAEAPLYDELLQDLHNALGWTEKDLIGFLSEPHEPVSHYGVSVEEVNGV